MAFSFSYLAKCIVRQGSSTDCPSCKSHDTLVIDSKYLNITRLYECQNCLLRFRFPIETHAESFSLYQDSYSQAGLTTDLPADKDLDILVKSSFRGSEKDFSHVFPLIKEISVQASKSLKILDFGANWGYGVFQFGQQYFVQSSCGYEISLPRRRFGEEKLKVSYIDSPENLDEAFDIVFSSHVIEHLIDPVEFKNWCDKCLKPGGFVILTCPNGSDSARKELNYWSKLWNKVHPSFISDNYLMKLFTGYTGVIIDDNAFYEHSYIQDLFQSKTLVSLLPTSPNLWLIAQRPVDL